ncbi:MAG: glycosyltransferase [Bacteroidales bacterium]|nr:glycosyltransferase [Bacteroidales bacterium]
MPKVSVIIPIYNVAPHLKRCVDSLMNQTLDDMEFIFVEDCSTDDSPSVLEEALSAYPERRPCVKLIRHETNMGLTRSRNDGLSVAAGDYIAHCDSDDWVDHAMYEKLYLKAVAEDADIAMCDFWFARENGDELYHTMSPSGNHDEDVRRYIGKLWTVAWNLIIRRSLYETYGLRSPEHICYTEDFYLTVRAVYYASKIAKVDEPLYWYNQMNSGSIMHNLNEKSRTEERISYLDTIAFFEVEGVLDRYEREMGWRILKNKQILVLLDRFDEFMAIWPRSHRYIWSVRRPFCDWKIRILMTLVVCGLRWPVHMHNVRKHRA